MARSDPQLGSQAFDCDSSFLGTTTTNEYNTDANTDKNNQCYICLDAIGQTNRAGPECCSHKFCVFCLTEWSKNVNTCPIDRRMYRKMIVFDRKNRITKRLPVAVLTDNTHCELCRLSTDRTKLVHCTECGNMMHSACRGIGIANEHIREYLCPMCDVTNANCTLPFVAPHHEHPSSLVLSNHTLDVRRSNGRYNLRPNRNRGNEVSNRSRSPLRASDRDGIEQNN